MTKANKNKTIIIIGARIDGHAGVVLDTLEAAGGYQVIGFIDNTPTLQGKTVSGIKVLGSSEDIASLPIKADCVHVAIGDNVARGRIFETLKKRKIAVETVIHPTAVISTQAKIGEGCFIGARTVIQTAVTIGDASIINTGSILEHNNVIGFAVHVAPGTKTAGRVTIKDYTFVGLGSTVLPDITIGEGAMVGAGTTVVKDVPNRTTIVGYAGRKHTKNIYVDVKPDVGSAKVYVAQPSLPEYGLLEPKFKDIAGSLMLSNFARFSTEFETELETSLQVTKALTFPNCTSALMLTFKAMGLTGEVILPSFTFSATGHAVVWNGLTPVFADIDPKTFNLDPLDVKRKITKKTSAIVGVHVFGCPADIPALEKIAKDHQLKLIFDAAHGLGSKYHNKPIGGFGDVECFSLSGTKVITSAEGGIVTSNDKTFMAKMALGRNYGAGPDYDCQYIGLNGKMSEFHAAIGLESMALLEDFVAQRNRLVELYKKRLSEIPGLTLQHIPQGCVSSYKDFAVLVDDKKFGMSRDTLVKKLQDEHIYTKKYFYPLHRMTAYQSVIHRAEGLSTTEYVADHIICLPIFSHMSEDTVEKVCYTMLRLHRASGRK